MAGMGGAIASGAASGAGMGSRIGSMIPVPGAGLAGAAIGAAVGGTSAGIKKNQANQAQEIPSVDPMERARLAQLEQTRKSVSSGSDLLTQMDIQNQRRAGAAMQSGLSKVTGGDVGGTIDALLKAGKATQGGINTSVAQAAQRIPYLDTAKGAMINKIADRRLQLGLMDRAQKSAETAQAQTDNNVNTQSLLATQGGTQTIPEAFGDLKNLAGRIGSIGSGVKADAFAETQGQPLPTGEPILSDPSIGDVQGIPSSTFQY